MSEGFTFRIRVNRSPFSTITCDRHEYPIPVSQSQTIYLRAVTPDLSGTITKATEWAFSGDGYGSENQALEAAGKVRDALLVALTRRKLGVDFGDRAPKSHWYPYGLEWLKATTQTESPIVNNVHGIMAYPSEPRPRFASMNVTPLRGLSPALFEEDFVPVFSQGVVLSLPERVAFELFHAALFQRGDARFVLLVMAMETLIEPALRSSDAVTYVDGFIETVKNSTLPTSEKNSMLGSLRYLKSESIGQTGRRLVAQRLGTKLYQNKPAAEFFSDVYDMRSRLVHGLLPFPTFDEVSKIVSDVELMASDLLTSPYLPLT